MAATAAPPQSKSPAILMGSDPRRPSRWEAPYKWDGTGSSRDRLLGWMRESIAEGEWFLKSQQGYRFVDTSYRIMNDIGFDELPSTLSKASMNFVKRDVREQVGMLSNPRPITSYKTLNKDFDQQNFVLNNCYMGWYYHQYADRSIGAALKYSAVEGTGYLIQEWEPGYYGATSDVKLTPAGVDAVLPVQINPDTWDLQSSYAVIIRRQYPITHVIRRFPQYSNLITPDGEAVGRLRRILSNILDRVTPTVHNTYGSQRGYRGEDPSARHFVTVYDIYVMDGTTNLSGYEQTVGIPGSPWEYKVPSYGQEIALPYGTTDGRATYRKADWHDCRMFPYRRHIVATRNTILSDDTSRYWHGQVPVTKFVLDPWPMEYCGIPLPKEPAKLQAMATSLLRAWDDSANAKLRPPVTFDGNRTNSAEARAFDPRAGGQVFEASDALGPVFKIAMDPTYYQMGENTPKFIQQIRDWAGDLIGNPGMRELAKAAQIPSGDSIEKLMELAGPLPTDLSRNMEAALRSMGEQFKCNVFEWYSVARRFTILGPDGVTTEDFDLDPGQLVPDTLRLDGIWPGATRAQRARAHMLNFYFWVLPNSIYGITQSSRKLLTLQLARMGMPISPYTIMEQFDIPNPGRPPKNPDGTVPVTEIDKWKAWKREETDVMIEQQMKLTQAQLAMQMQAQAADPLGQLSGAIQQAIQKPTAGTPPQEGRPPTAQRQPHTEQKGDGRTVISES